MRTGGSIRLCFLLLILFLLPVHCAERLTVFAPSGLNLRQSPDPAAKIITLLPPGTEVQVLEKSRLSLSFEGIQAPWLRVRSGEFEGWAFSGFLSDDPGVLQAAKDCADRNKSLSGRECMPPWIALVRSHGAVFHKFGRIEFKLEPDGSVLAYTTDPCEIGSFSPTSTTIGSWTVEKDIIKAEFESGGAWSLGAQETVWGPYSGLPVCIGDPHSDHFEVRAVYIGKGLKITDVNGGRVVECDLGHCG